MRTVLVCGGMSRGEIVAGLAPRLSIESVILPPKIPIQETVTIGNGSDSSNTTSDGISVKLLYDDRLEKPRIPFYRRFTERRRRHR